VQLNFRGRKTSGCATSCAITTKLQSQRSPRPQKLGLFESAAKRAGELGVYAVAGSQFDTTAISKRFGVRVFYVSTFRGVGFLSVPVSGNGFSVCLGFGVGVSFVSRFRVVGFLCVTVSGVFWARRGFGAWSFLRVTVSGCGFSVFLGFGAWVFCVSRFRGVVLLCVFRFRGAPRVCFVAKWIQMDLRWTSDGRQMDLRWTSGGRKMDLRWTSGGPQMGLRWTSDGPQMDLRWTSDGFRWSGMLLHSHTFMTPREAFPQGSHTGLEPWSYEQGLWVRTPQGVMLSLN
jgi:hypothetical protein